eukprot:3939228-Rhodomonas_salina.4
MEMVAMVMASLPVPPMPMIVGKEVPDEITVMSGDYTICNSHDLMGMLLLTAMSRDQKKENEIRSNAQKECMQALFDDIKSIGATETTTCEIQERVYDAFCKFTRGNISALSSSTDVRFAPLASIQREDRIHIATCHHCAAQDIIYGLLKTDSECEQRCAEAFSEHSYVSLMMRQYARMQETL